MNTDVSLTMKVRMPNARTLGHARAAHTNGKHACANENDSAPEKISVDTCRGDRFFYCINPDVKLTLSCTSHQD